MVFFGLWNSCYKKFYYLYAIIYKPVVIAVGMMDMNYWYLVLQFGSRMCWRHSSQYNNVWALWRSDWITRTLTSSMGWTIDGSKFDGLFDSDGNRMWGVVEGTGFCRNYILLLATSCRWLCSQIAVRWATLLKYMLPPWWFCLLKNKSLHGNNSLWSWSESSETLSQNKSSSF